ncbi:MAG: EamA family transporter [Pseudomonadota bacterium]
MATHNPNMALRGSLSIFFSASLWGLFWIPLHYFDERGLVALWAVAAVNFAGCVIGIPFALMSKEKILPNLKWLVIVGMGMGISNVLYFAGILLSDVVRIVFLFYLLPLWATLFSWLIFGEAIGRARMFALAIAFVGIWLLLGAGGWPIPQDIGDIFGLLSGAGWAFGLAMIRGRNDLEPFSLTASGLLFAFMGACLLGGILTTIAPDIQPPLPNTTSISMILIPVFLFGVLILWPTLLGQIWGARYVAATTAALLTMSEIMTATVSTTLVGASDMALISWIGAGLILTAIFIDLLGGQHA